MVLHCGDIHVFFFFCLYHIKIFCAREEKSKPQQHADEDEEPLHRWRDVPAAVVDLCSLSKKKRQITGNDRLTGGFIETNNTLNFIQKHIAYKQVTVDYNNKIFNILDIVCQHESSVTVDHREAVMGHCALYSTATDLLQAKTVVVAPMKLAVVITECQPRVYTGKYIFC